MVNLKLKIMASFRKISDMFFEGDIIVVDIVLSKTYPQQVVLHLLNTSIYGFFKMNIEQKPLIQGKRYIFTKGNFVLTNQKTAPKIQHKRPPFVSYWQVGRLFHEGAHVIIDGIISKSSPQQVLLHSNTSSNFEFVRLNVDQSKVKIGCTYSVGKNNNLIRVNRC